ncbi:MAG: pyridoxamine 5'-phosphate oxidase family protein [Oscillospiraceae bacterium]|nr:pyridoxamine 5'-phosphate oxidase family protein [Oscillospiraceae bacterium]
MFRSMRRYPQLLSREETEAVLKSGSNGVLAVAGDEGYPYAVPISYVYEEGKIWFHGAKTGHKLDAIRACDKVSFCVVDQDRVIQETYTTHFRSAIAFGRARVLTDDGEKRAALLKLAEKYSPDMTMDSHHQAIDREWKPVCVVEILVEHMTGKEAIELVRARKQGL